MERVTRIDRPLTTPVSRETRCAVDRQLENTVGGGDGGGSRRRQVSGPQPVLRLLPSCSMSTITAKPWSSVTAPCPASRTRPARRRQLPGVRDRLDQEGGVGLRPTAPVVTDWATDLDHIDPSYNRKRRRSGGPCATAAARWPTPTGTTGCGPRSPRARHRGGLRHRALYEPRRRRQPGPDGRLREGPDRRSAADHHDPPFHTTPAAAAPSVSPRRSNPGRPRSARSSRRLDAAAVGAESSTLPSATPSTSRSPSSPTCSAFHPTTGRSASSSRYPRAVNRDTQQRIGPPPRRLPRRAIAEHEAEPTDDLITYLLNVELFGEPLSDGHVLGSLRLLLIAGIDTTWSAIGAAVAPGEAPRRSRRLSRSRS